MRSLAIIFSVLLVLFSLQDAQAKIIHVPADSATIQKGIDGAVNGDTVLVAPGTYHEAPRIEVKSIILSSEFMFTGDTNSIHLTVIEDNGLQIFGVPNPGCIFSGFTVNRGGIDISSSWATISHNYILNGSGVVINGGPVTILHNTIAHNQNRFAGGISCLYASFALIRQNVISDNQGERGGGILFWTYSGGSVEENLITNNIAVNGAAVYCTSSSPTILNNTISHNTGVYAGGVYCAQYGDQGMTIRNNIISNSADGFGIYYHSLGKATNPLLLISYNDVWGNADGEYGGSCPNQTGYNGNISADPLFCNPSNMNYLLSRSSPCVGSGENGNNIGAFSVGCGWVYLSPGADQIGAANTTVPVYFYIENQGDSSESFVLDASDDLAWTLQPSHFELTLNSGQIDTIELVVSIPDVPFGTADSVTLKAVSQSNPMNSDSASLVVTCKVYDVGILDISDIDNDQGKQVRIDWSSFPGNDSLVTHFTIFRKIDSLLFPALEVKAEIFSSKDYPPGTWQMIETYPAYGETLYSVVVPTLKDSTIAQGMYWSAFFIRAGTNNPIVYFDSPVDSGYSLDNLSPSPPTGLFASHVPASTKLIWHATTIPDFDYHTVYRDTIPGFPPSLNNRVGFSIDTTFTDSTAQLGRSYFYVITSSDFSGNESEPSNEAMGIRYITGDANTNGSIDLGDLVYLITYLYKNGPAPRPLLAGDINCDGAVALGDVVYLISYLYKGGPPPPC